jgi:hypothetical protein
MSPWLDSNVYVDHANITMLVPLICIFAMLIQLIFLKIKINSFIFMISIILIFLQHNKLNQKDYGDILSGHDKNFPNIATPLELENFSINIFKETNNKKEVNNDALTSAILFLENDRDKNKIDNQVQVKGVELSLRKGS